VKKKTKFYTNLPRNWVVVDAKDKVAGRLATRVALILKGKTKPTYTPNALCGDKVIIINVKQAVFTGKKLDDKRYDRYSGYPGGITDMPLKGLNAKNPCKAMYLAVKGMVPKGWLGKRMLRDLKIYTGAEHKQAAQKPVKTQV
jgi:large subunit ribosomal protein L13